MSSRNIPEPVIAVVGDVLGQHYYSHTDLDTLFKEHGAPGEPPPGNCVRKCQEWLKRCNEDPTVDAFQVLGGVLKKFMELTPSGSVGKQQERVRNILAQHGLSYQPGGKILGAALRAPSRSLDSLIRKRDLTALEVEFERALNAAESDPPAAVTAACAILEALCKVYIAENNLGLPSDQSIKPLWKIVQKHLQLDPASFKDQDVAKILGGLSSVVDGIGSLRTHAGSAHGRGRQAYLLVGRHARLAVHAAHTLVTFVIETWEARKGPAVAQVVHPES